MLKHLAAFSMAAAAFMATAPAEAASSTGMTANDPKGLRGDTITYRVQLTSGGAALKNQPIYFYDCSDARPYWCYKGLTCTDASGYARLTYRIPTSVWEDNVYLLGSFYGSSAYSPSSKATRIRIGIR